MIIRKLDEVKTVEWGNGLSRRFLLEADGMGYTMTDTIVNKGTKSLLEYENHLEACYCIEGEAELTERDTGVVHWIGPGSVYSPEHDRHTIRVISPLRLVCVFNPALTGRETHDADGSYLPAED